jgi:hypothetical protein
MKISSTVIFLWVSLLIDPALAQQALPSPQITKNETVEGNLIIGGDEVRKIENTHLKVLGRIIVQDSSQLIVRQSIIELEDKGDFGAVSSGTIEVKDSGILRADTTIFGAVAAGGIDPAQAEFLKSGDLIGRGNSQVYLNYCFSQTQSFFERATAIIKNSLLIQEPLGIIHVEHDVDVTLEDCEIGAIFLDLPPSVTYYIDGLVPGYHNYWSARESISEELPYELVMRRCTLNDNDDGFQGGMEMGWNLGFNAIASSGTISNSKLNKIIFGFPPDEPAVIEGLKIQEPIDFVLNDIQIFNTEVQTQWGIFMEGGPATLTDCEGLFIFMFGGQAPIKVINSEVYEIDPRGYTGTLIFENSVFGGGYEVFDSSHLYMEGTMRARNPLAFLDNSSEITRAHQIQLLFDNDGMPFPPFPLRIMKDSLEVWRGMTNYQDEWILESLDPSVFMEKRFGLDASNPITINLRMIEGDTVFSPVIHVMREAPGFPDGSQFHPYPSIQEAVDNASGERILVPPGVYPGNTPPGSSEASVFIFDNITLQGAGAGSTLLNAALQGEDVVNSMIIGFEIREGFQLRNASFDIRNCLVANHEDHALVAAGADLRIFNNTFVNNSGDALFLIDSSIAEIRNNIFAMNNGFGLEVLPGSTVESDYNNIWENGENYVNADLIGTHDISLDPLFVNTHEGDYHLLGGSPCIDAGDPRTMFNDPDGSRNDLGALGGPYGDLTTSSKNNWVEEPNLQLEIYPNPTGWRTNIKYYLDKSTWVHLGIYDLQGRLIDQLINTNLASGDHMLAWFNHRQLNGLYIIQLQTESGMLFRRMVILP